MSVGKRTSLSIGKLQGEAQTAAFLFEGLSWGKEDGHAAASCMIDRACKYKYG